MNDDQRNDEMTRKAALAIGDNEACGSCAGPEPCSQCTSDAGAALGAVLPDILDEAKHLELNARVREAMVSYLKRLNIELGEEIIVADDKFEAIFAELKSVTHERDNALGLMRAAIGELLASRVEVEQLKRSVKLTDELLLDTVQKGKAERERMKVEYECKSIVHSCCETAQLFRVKFYSVEALACKFEATPGLSMSHRNIAASIRTAIEVEG